MGKKETYNGDSTLGGKHVYPILNEFKGKRRGSYFPRYERILKEEKEKNKSMKKKEVEPEWGVERI